MGTASGRAPELPLAASVLMSPHGGARPNSGPKKGPEPLVTRALQVRRPLLSLQS